MFGVIQMSLLGWGLFTILISIAAALIYPLCRSKVAALSPGYRAVLLRALALTPLFLGLGLVALCFVPSAVEAIVLGTDHCSFHGTQHLHFCTTHVSVSSGAALGWLIVGSIGSAFFVRASGVILQLADSHRLLGQLAATARFDPESESWLVDSDNPFALTTGVFQKRRIVSRALAQALPHRLLGAVLAHESAHEQRNDALWKAIVLVLSLPHLPSIRRAILADLEFACEQACDESAGTQLGDRLRVAEALLAVQRARHDSQGFGGLAAVSFGVQGVLGRVESLMASKNEFKWGRRSVLACLAGASILLLILADPLHHSIETLVDLIPR